MNTEQGLSAAMSMLSPRQQPSVGGRPRYLPQQTHPAANATVTSPIQVDDWWILPSGSRVKWLYDGQGKRWFEYQKGTKTYATWGAPPEWVAVDQNALIVSPQQPTARVSMQQQRMRSLRGLGEIPMEGFSQALAAASSMVRPSTHDLELAAGLGALFEGFGAYEMGSTYYVTTQDSGRLGSLLIQPTSGDSGKGSAIGYFPKNSPVKIASAPVGNKVQVTGEAWSLGVETGGNDQPMGATTGWVPTSFLSTTQGGVAWQPGSGGGGGGGGDVEDRGNLPVKKETSTTTETDLVPYILGGAALLGGGIILWAVMSPKKGGAKRRGRRRKISRHMGRRRARR